MERGEGINTPAKISVGTFKKLYSSYIGVHGGIIFF
jgi:hypothetical protein